MGKNKEKSLAKDLYLSTDLDLKIIADKVGVTAKTIGKWKEEENWDSLKTAKSVTRQEIIANKYNLLSELVQENRRKLKAKELTNGDIDAEHKLSMSIKAIQDEETLSGYIQAFTPFLNWLRAENLEAAKVLAQYTDKYLLIKAGELN
jgi:DNA-binding XRE family transcriptional regulator